MFFFNIIDDFCFDKWQCFIFGDCGIYVFNGFVVVMFFKFIIILDGFFDMFVFGGLVNFYGYYLGYSYVVVVEFDFWIWVVFKVYFCNMVGFVCFWFVDLLDVFEINYNYFDIGSGDWRVDIQIIVEGIEFVWEVLCKQFVWMNEIFFGVGMNMREELEVYIKDISWGYYVSLICFIGFDGDLMVVLDSKFWVRGVKGLRVVDVSVYFRILGIFIVVLIMMVVEKVVDDILVEVN